MLQEGAVGRTRLNELCGNERGAVSIFIALGMVVFLGSAAIAIDLGHMMNVRTESQAVADAAALAGASGFIDASGAALQPTIETRAIDFASRNSVNRTTVALPVGDIQIDVANERVRVTIRHTVATGNAIQTIFARVLGINEVDVVTTAVAQAFPASGAKCILPFMLPDRYLENGGNPNLYDGPPDTYSPYDPTTMTGTGYSETNIGDILIIKPSQGNNPGKPNPSWYYPIAAYATGGAAYRDAIAGCVDPTRTYAIGDMVQVEPGAMLGPTRQGVNRAIASDPDHGWSDAYKCVIDVVNGPSNVCLPSKRLRAVPMMAPPDAPGNGRKNVQIMNWAGVFLVGMSGNDVIVRFAGYSAFAATIIPGGGGGALPKVILLVE